MQIIKLNNHLLFEIICHKLNNSNNSNKHNNNNNNSNNKPLLRYLNKPRKKVPKSRQ